MSNKRKSDYLKQRQLILATPLPRQIETNLKGRSRVAVRTVRDLELYVSFIAEVSAQYSHYYGHKKIIAELVGVSTNRISEWQRIWQSATQGSQSTRILKCLNDKDVALSELVDAVKEANECSALSYQYTTTNSSDIYSTTASSNMSFHSSPMTSMSSPEEKHLTITGRCMQTSPCTTFSSPSYTLSHSSMTEEDQIIRAWTKQRLTSSKSSGDSKSLHCYIHCDESSNVDKSVEYSSSSNISIEETFPDYVNLMNMPIMPDAFLDANASEKLPYLVGQDTQWNHHSQAVFEGASQSDNNGC